MNKKGQFFLIAAIVIVGIIITLSAINISTKTPAKENTAFYDLSKEIAFESNKLIDYGVYQYRGQTSPAPSVTSLVANYSAVNPDTDMLFIYGNRTALTILLYNKTSLGTESFGTGGAPVGINIETRTPTTPGYLIEGNNVTVQLGGIAPLTFELQPGENFFIVLKKEAGEETLVAKEE